MKSVIIHNLTIKMLILTLLTFGCFLPLRAESQEYDYQEASEQYSQEELAQMLAPIALYPDTLLSQVLMASTYPIEVIEADRWVKRNSDLQEEDLDNALLNQNWDPSIKALCHFPSVLALMSERIGETTNIGNAFLAQEGEVLDMVQVLRGKAHTRGNLTTSSKQRVIVEGDTIIIEPATRIIYVPYYDPFTIYGPWWYTAYPPYVWSPSGIRLGIGLSYWPSVYFGFTFTDWSYFDWHYHYVYIDVYKRPRYVRDDHWARNPGRWNHTPSHRRGVAYRDKATARQFGQRPYPQREYKQDARGFADHDRSVQKSIQVKPPVNRQTEQDRLRTTSPTRLRDGQKTERITVEPKSQRLNSSDKAGRITTELQNRKRKMKTDDKPQRAVIREQKHSPVAESVRNERRREEVIPKASAKIDPSKQARKEIKSRQKEQKQENFFDPLEDGEQARQASERGRDSRQRSNDSRGKKADSKGHEDRSREKR